MIPSPNIIILHDQDRIAFYNKTSKKISKTRPFINDEARAVLNVNEILKDKSSIILIINCDYFFLDRVIDYINSQKIKKIYFFINDIFRIIHPYSPARLETYVLEKDLKSCVVNEIEILKIILEKTKIKEKEIYHCEYNNKLIEKKYDIKFKYFDIFLSNYIEKTSSADIVYDSNITKKISCFNHRTEMHRHLISSLLYNKKDCIVTYSNKFWLDQVLNNKELPISEFSVQKELKKSLKRFDKKDLHIIKDNQFVSLPDKKEYLHLDGLTQQDWLVFETIKNSFVNLVTETRFSSLSAYVSEKSIKPMYMYRPFILLSSYGTLDLIKKLGFKTFDKWWDESYDLEKNHVKRFDMVYSIVKEILSYDKDKMINILNEMKPILEHNHNNLKNIDKMMNSLN
jgi:hypothetical protein